MPPISEKPAILIVEDEPLVGSYISDVLKEFGFEIAGCASCGPEAIALAEQNEPRLAVVDIRLTGRVDGIEVARILHARFGVLAIFLSGAEDEATITRAHQARPLGFLKKPFLPSQLLDAIHEAIGSLGAGASPADGISSQATC